MEKKPDSILPIICVFAHNLLNIGNIFFILGQFDNIPNKINQLELDEENKLKLITFAVFVISCIWNVFGLSGYKAGHQGVIIVHSLGLCLASLVFTGFLVNRVLMDYELKWVYYLISSAEGLIASVFGLYYSQMIINYNWGNNQEIDLAESLISGKCANCGIETSQVVSFTNEGILLCYACVLNVKVLPKKQLF